MTTPGTTYSTDPALYIFTSLTSGSSHIVTATSRLETILRANKVPFKAVDIAVDEKARMLWGRRAGKDPGGRMRKLPGLVQEGMVLGDLVEIEEWNEYGEVKQNVKFYYDENTIPPISQKPKTPPPKRAAALAAQAAPPAPPPAPTGRPKEAAPKAESSSNKSDKPSTTATKMTLPIRSIADEAAQKAKSMRLQSLRDKVHGKKDGDEPTADGSGKAASDSVPDPGKGEEAEEESKPVAGVAAAAATTTTTTTSPGTPRRSGSTDSGGFEQPQQHAGLQSPTTAAWKASASAAPDHLREPLQSPTSTSWQSTAHLAGVGGSSSSVTSLHGSLVDNNASQEEIAAIERAETIDEDPDAEERAEKECGSPPETELEELRRRSQAADEQGPTAAARAGEGGGGGSAKKPA